MFALCVNHFITWFDVTSFINFSINYFLFNYPKIVHTCDMQAFFTVTIFFSTNQHLLMITIFGHLNCTDPILGLNIKSKFYKRIFICVTHTQLYLWNIFNYAVAQCANIFGIRLNGEKEKEFYRVKHNIISRFLNYNLYEIDSKCCVNWPRHRPMIGLQSMSPYAFVQKNNWKKQLLGSENASRIRMPLINNLTLLICVLIFSHNVYFAYGSFPFIISGFILN